MSGTENAIHVHDLKHSYDGKRFVVDDVSFDVHNGEIYGLLGRNGAGKTTTIKILTSLIRATSGKISVLGMDPAKAGNRLRSRIGVVLQDDSFDFTTVEKSFDIYGYIWNVEKSVRERRKEELIALFELDRDRKKRMWDLSGGQKRRVQVAREFIHDMDLLFLDEPTVGLDPLTRRNILEMIKERTRDGLTVLFTTHNLEEAEFLCDRVAIMNTGKILAQDTISSLKKSYSGLKTIEVTFEGDASKVLDGLENASVDQPKVSGEPYKIVTSDQEGSIKHLLEKSRVNGIPISWLNIRSVTLEDVFLKTIKEDPGIVAQ
ncbi:MAG: ABC transporter ATP-binding protein [Thermoplasmataceae archaeon]|jgi:ABC-2 type transport system ATP-binding protein